MSGGCNRQATQTSAQIIDMGWYYRKAEGKLSLSRALLPVRGSQDCHWRAISPLDAQGLKTADVAEVPMSTQGIQIQRPAHMAWEQIGTCSH